VPADWRDRRPGLLGLGHVFLLTLRAARCRTSAAVRRLGRTASLDVG
jgi:hypothetical protein